MMDQRSGYISYKCKYEPDTFEQEIKWILLLFYAKCDWLELRSVK